MTADKTRALEVAAWVLAHGHQDPTPVRVTLGGRHVYVGVRYRAVYHYSAGMEAVRAGRATAGMPYYRDRFYLLGKLPSRLGGRRRAYCFPLDGAVWYASGHYDGPAAEFQPFGRNFALDRWDVPGGAAIDAGAEKPYARVAIAVALL